MLESELLPAEILGISESAAKLRAFTESAASNSEPAMLVGEPGTGKQLMARVIHENSARKGGPLLVVDCSLYYERELKRELFGYGGSGACGKERGGVFDSSRKGTCYLSHVEELTPALQESLLTFLLDGKYARLGDGKLISSDTRFLASSEKNLEAFVRSGLFSDDLYQAIRTQMHFCSPLRERKEDIAVVVETMCAAGHGQETAALPPVFDADAMAALKSYPWPGNFDELTREVSRVLQSGTRDVRTQNLAAEIAGYWLGQRGDRQTRRVIEELDGFIREFRILSRIGCEFGDPTVESGDLSFEHPDMERDLLEDFWL